MKGPHILFLILLVCVLILGYCNISAERRWYLQKEAQFRQQEQKEKDEKKLQVLREYELYTETNAYIDKLGKETELAQPGEVRILIKFPERYDDSKIQQEQRNIQNNFLKQVNIHTVDMENWEKWVYYIFHTNVTTW